MRRRNTSQRRKRPNPNLPPPTAKARRVLAALLRLGWTIKREASSHKVLSRIDWLDTVFAFHDGDEIGPRMLARIAKCTGLKASDL